MPSRQERVNSRENSTLVVATVAASASLLVLALVLQSSISKGSWVIVVGIVFSILGPLYREVTVFTIDSLDYQEIENVFYKWWATIPRMVILRFFLFLPIASWFIFLASSQNLLAVTMIIVFLIAIALSVVEWTSCSHRIDLKKGATSPGAVESTQNDKGTPTNSDKSKFIWDLVYILFSVALSGIVFNATQTDLFAPGKLLIYYVLSKESIQFHSLQTQIPIGPTFPLFTTIVFGALMILNIWILAYVHEKGYIQNAHGTFRKYLAGFILGISPALFWYLLYIFAWLLQSHF